MTTVKRIDPRRPFIIAVSGLRRITLGEDRSADAANAISVATARMGHARSPKPRRAYEPGARRLLVVAHSDRGALDEHARQAVAAAAIVADMQTEVVLLVLGELTDDAAALGADKVISWPALARPAFAPDRALAALRECAAAYAPAHILMPDNATGDGDLGRRYAAQARASIATHVVEIDAQHVGCFANGGRSFATRAWPEVILLDAEAVSAKLPFVGAGERVAAPVSEIASDIASGAADADRYADRGTLQLDAAQVALEEADFIISAGNGVTDIAAFETLARALGAAVGASRVAVDNGHFARDKQVGATGKTVNASVYIAFGISGAVQHLQGIKDCRHVIAVNLDASAPIAKRANLTLIADAQTTMAALTHAVEAAKQARAAPVSAAAQTKLREDVAA